MTALRQAGLSGGACGFVLVGGWGEEAGKEIEIEIGIGIGIGIEIELEVESALVTATERSEGRKVRRRSG